LWIALLDGDRTNILQGLIIKDRRPRVTSVLGFPNTPGGSANEDDVGIGYHCIDRCNSSAHTGRTDVAGFPVLEFVGVERLGPRSACQQNRQAKGKKVVFQVERI
jgi:hypothetical protein